MNVVPFSRSSDVKMNKKHRSENKTDTVFYKTDMVDREKWSFRARIGPGFTYPRILVIGRRTLSEHVPGNFQVGGPVTGRPSASISTEPPHSGPEEPGHAVRAAGPELPGPARIVRHEPEPGDRVRRICSFTLAYSFYFLKHCSILMIPAPAALYM